MVVVGVKEDVIIVYCCRGDDFGFGFEGLMGFV